MNSEQLRITGKTQVVGLIGDPVEHSRSPAMHNAAFAALGLDWVYVSLPVRSEDVAAAVGGVRALGLRGVNVTMPHKATVIPHLDEIARGARLIGAVNTIVRQGDQLLGENTDGKGFVRALREKAGLEPKGRRVLLFGAGGAARALAVELAMAGAGSVAIVNRTTRRAEELAARVTQATGCETLAVPWDPRAWQEVLAGADIVVNATRAGMQGEPDFVSEIPWECLKDEAVVCDAVYEPVETAFLRAAAARGLKTLDGLLLLLFQGVLAFELWTGRPAPVEVMARAIGVRC